MNKEKTGKTTLMQLQINLSIKILLTIVIMFALIALVYFLKIPNPNMILIAGLVLCSAIFGFGGGIVAAVIMLGYTLYFFSIDNSFTQFTPENLQKVWVSLIGIAADMLLVCFLKQTEVRAFKQIETLTEKLQSENELLQYMSLYDALTGIKNRMALRQDYELLQGHEVTVMMLDLNDFKQINDTRGHETGDHVLRETGKLLADVFGKNHCYRYGGDEFLIIIPEITESEFLDKLEFVERNKPMIDETIRSEYSYGYVRGVLNTNDTLRRLISKADEKMYEAKSANKR